MTYLVAISAYILRNSGQHQRVTNAWAMEPKVVLCIPNDRIKFKEQSTGCISGNCEYLFMVFKEQNKSISEGQLCPLFLFLYMLIIKLPGNIEKL